jgi:hypothetical protein
LPTVAPNFGALVPAWLGEVVSQKKCVKLSASHSITNELPERAIVRMLMHFTPGCESQASFRAVDEPVVVVVVVVDPPTAVVVEDEPPVVVLAPSDPRGGNVTVELVLSSPPHEDSTRAAATVATRTSRIGERDEASARDEAVPGRKLHDPNVDAPEKSTGTTRGAALLSPRLSNERSERDR